jgi:hypothetical protein
MERLVLFDGVLDAARSPTLGSLLGILVVPSGISLFRLLQTAFCNYFSQTEV